MQHSKFLLVLVGYFVLLASCKKGTTEPEKYGGLNMKISHHVDGKPVFWDTIMYANKAGNVYSLARLQYFLSDFVLYSRDGKTTRVDTVLYVDGRDETGTIANFRSLPVAVYDSVAFIIGVDAAHNVPFGLPPTREHSQMDWPEMMGGGYHFIKMEGHWRDDAPAISGYAIHLGKPGLQVQAGCRIYTRVEAGSPGQLHLTMNINEWYEHPYTYDLQQDGVYTMGDDALMRRIQQNGSDVFKSLP